MNSIEGECVLQAEAVRPLSGLGRGEPVEGPFERRGDGASAVGSTPVRQRVVAHPVLSHLGTQAALGAFMQCHVFAVWDFMSLLKRLQADHAPVRAPWLPPVSRRAARLVNEIVLEEESDLGPDGEPISHLELYLQAMEEVGADRSVFCAFLDALRSLAAPSASDARSAIRTTLAGGEAAALLSETREAIVRFVETTLDIVEHGAPHEVIAALLFGREDPIPAMYRAILSGEFGAGFGSEVGGGVEPVAFRYYLERHIELDEGEHQGLLESLLDEVKDGEADSESVDKDVLAVSQRCLEVRAALWDAALDEVTLAQKR